MRRYWLIFAQAVTVCLGILFVVTTLRPDLLRLAGSEAMPAAVPQPVMAPGRPTMGPVSYADGVARAAPSVVNVYTTKHVNVPLVPLPDDPILRQLFGQVPGVSRRQASTSLGSGVVVNHDGYVLTNYHVVQAADAIEVALADGRKDTAKVVGADPDTDLAVLKLATLRNLPAATLAPDRGLRVGDVVLAIGNPFGVGQTTTQGIVSALGRNGLGLNTYENFIQTDAAINPGNSGGALVDAQGNLVGINTAIYSESGGSMGIGFATPIDIARKVMDEIVKTGGVKRGWLGVEPQDLTPELARAFQMERDARGVIIAGVLRDGPAAKGGLRVGDIVQTVNGKPMMDTSGLLAAIAQLTPGQRATLGVLRGGKVAEVTVVVGTRPGLPR
ncbi:trypsin-like peptidase domain-containing protein [Achromobacter xylosoxidans]|uniref:trypsin-like peptidase domain-containing protein n=1 Tax=Alcaligenes xylosoxydans xylosoxydans TaxID=85698 RepID=UPI0005D76DE3|nr:trypsin-like peptidase domain-containing protein [Achromobacter xylosoxidans]MCH1992644.1 trypsin-like peptidase domain-containing protein [Achromobacter xylosoxidans]OFL40408.1 2-alkenal reductase [Achromobacter xylosoxidans]OFS66815.1 2-alkenal reductase [Achromobacter xylosoxidans]QKQ54993.1 trypsin-like peptidase domain-containing protein [Achromobacter xylosoxidans]QPR95854.1 trypsin-like peptidase domain-containing protein [Achromobacter xylosoxidans]